MDRPAKASRRARRRWLITKLTPPGASGPSCNGSMDSGLDIQQDDTTSDSARSNDDKTDLAAHPGPSPTADRHDRNRAGGAIGPPAHRGAGRSARGADVDRLPAGGKPGIQYGQLRLALFQGGR